MRKHHSFKLLTKTTAIYLLFTFIAFFCSAVFLIREADKFIGYNLEISFTRSENRLQRHLEEGNLLEGQHPTIQVLSSDVLPDLAAYPLYSDTVIYNSGLDEIQRFRKKTIILQSEGQYYKAILLQPLEDFLRLREDILESLIPAFILLAVGIVLFNYLLSGYFFRPFNRILNLMITYKVGQGSEIKKISTQTTEFIKMQELFHQMIERIEDDYRHLKEYTENMAHEIQTPLAVILNKIEDLIADKSVMQRNAESVKIIYDETNYLSKLGNSLNLLTKIENREFNRAIEIKSQPIIQKHIAAIEELAKLKSLSVETDLLQEHYLLIDPYLLDIILKNLIGNAINHSTSVGPIRIKTTKDYLEISNFAPPLDVPEEKLFQRFYRKNASNTSLGLGLSLVKKICDLNNLVIQYDYQAGKHIFTIKSRTEV